MKGCSLSWTTFTSSPNQTEWGRSTARCKKSSGTHSRIRIHGGKTHVWNQAGVKPDACEALQRVAEALDPTGQVKVWRGSEVPSAEQGIKVLGTPIGHPEFVAAHLERTLAEHQVLLSRIPSIPDVQCAWLLLLHCASARATYLLRAVRPELVRPFAAAHDQGLWQCFCQILQISTDLCDDNARATASLPLSLGGLGLRSAVRTSHPASWASWADCLPMINKRHPEVAAQIMQSLEDGPTSPTLRSLSEVARHLEGLQGFTVPPWQALADGYRPPPHEPEDQEPGTQRQGWQHEALISGRARVPRDSFPQTCGP